MENNNQPLDADHSGKPNKRSTRWGFETIDVSHCAQPELSADGILVVQDCVIRLSNHAMTGISAYGQEEILDTCVVSFFDTEYMAAVQSLCEHILQGPDGPQILEATLVCKNGHRALTQITALPCTYKQRPACLLTIRLTGFITSLSEGITRDCHDFLTDIVADPSPVPSS